MAFDMKDFDKFDRVVYPNVCYAGLLQYDGDLKLPARFLVNPPEIKNTLTELLVDAKINELLFAFSTDPGSLNKYKGYVISPNNTEGFVESFSDAGKELLAMGGKSYIIVASDYGYHVIYFVASNDNYYDSEIRAAKAEEDSKSKKNK